MVSVRNMSGPCHGHIGSWHGDCRLVVCCSKSYALLIEHKDLMPVSTHDSWGKETEAGKNMRMMLLLIWMAMWQNVELN